ncbi:uncharacterized protein TEOVI_000635000 [Trypanosoma equiperdum]|uniref:LRRK2 ARM repeat domain-containing protein n=4 Tax=Trypanozoon TaxID=39700 RepID=Q584T5_TRYB2|nr:hypothetical protein, conserved [Trypanosoma brucei gambiense DAL972]XP_845342.1 hypothetical protein, conserved [Trypanosoma brucei brucei TREU927]AAX80854.1 hypothetical protein, conserved [Trypanosoma brucei]RHW72151.1 hypothetical protein DPX39_060025200 [Trypanosoma brucei equiperdum]SCU66657.1 hypothetical protein, conserved [Trypanosoma equiperdum]AAZ11783.1 hypothetical protein, conserved [Trypanosoma brucei brucei TREU927]CBH11721.1 hypothetical protein, conserved [Trypanosoma bru|eukprot:XP_011774006.1 hypothetical protein, conserved [Trypanosoma brucei gambiense DAL972]
MEGLFIRVVSGSPRQRHSDVENTTPEYTILCAQTPNAADRITQLMNRFRTSTEASSTQTMIYLLQTCVGTDVPPDEVENIVETLVGFANEHPMWTDTIQWICAFVHYYCTDEFTVSLFSEFEVPSVAVRALKEAPQNSHLVLAGCTLLSHFNLYPIGDGISQLTRALSMHSKDPLVCKAACRALAEFTSYVVEAPNLYVTANKEFVGAGGIDVLESVLHEQIGDEETTRYVARIAANAIGSGEPNTLEPDFKVVMYLAEALERYSDSEQLCSCTLRVFSVFPSSPYVDMNAIASLFKNTESEAVAIEAIHFLCSVAMSVKTLKQLIHTTGCVQRVLEVMRKYAGNASIQEYACSLLSYLSFDSETITSFITDANGIILVLAAMRNFPESEDLLVSACAALSGLTFNNLKGQEVIVSEKGVALILEAMGRGKSARLQDNGCLALGTMCWNSDLKADVIRYGGVQMIMRALAAHYTNAGLVKNACRALAQVAFNCEAYRDDMHASGVIPLIMKGMAEHPNYDRVQMHGCVALSYLSWNNEQNSAQIISNNGYAVIINAMRNHAHNAEVQEHASRALANIGGVRSDELTPALELIIGAMRRHEHVSEVQEETCRAIVTLSLISTSYKDKLFELGAAECVVTAMHNFPSTQVVQQEACNALAHLAYEHANLNRAVTELSGVEVLLRAMKTYVNVPKIQLNACGGLSALAFDNTIAQKQIYDLGGVACIIRAMENFERLRMLELGCSVLGTLAWNSEIKESVAVVAIPEILKAMRVHHDSPLLQKSTCRAISQFAFNSESNRKLLAESGAIPLIVLAMRTHVTTDKLLVHGIKALTYLCWENSQVAEAIISEGIEEVLQHVIDTYPASTRVYGEAAHLSKILFRKVTGSPNPSVRVYSPPVFSPVSVSQTPGSAVTRTDTAMLLSPPLRDASDVGHFYGRHSDTGRKDDWHPAEYQKSPKLEHQQQRQQHQRNNRGDKETQGPGETRGEIDGAGRRRRNRRRGGGGGGGGGGGRFDRPPNQCEPPGALVRDSPERRTEVHNTWSPRRDGGSSRPLSPDDLWDDPHPSTYHGNRELGNLSWQQVQLTRQQEERHVTSGDRSYRGGGGGGRGGRRYPNPRGNAPTRGRGDSRRCQ